MTKNKSIQAGFLYSLVGIIIGFYIALTSIGDGYEFFPIYAGLSAFLTFSLLWWLIVERKNKYGTSRGVISGILSGIISHYVCWYLFFIVANFQYYFWGSGLSSLGEPPQNLIESISGAMILSIWSLFFFGWLTVPAGGIIGGCFAWFTKHQAKTNK